MVFCIILKRDLFLPGFNRLRHGSGAGNGAIGISMDASSGPDDEVDAVAVQVSVDFGWIDSAKTTGKTRASPKRSFSKVSLGHLST